MNIMICLFISLILLIFISGFNLIRHCKDLEKDLKELEEICYDEGKNAAYGEILNFMYHHENTTKDDVISELSNCMKKLENKY